MNKFSELLKYNVNDDTKEKGGLTYLPWADAWTHFKKHYPECSYEIKMFDGLPYVKDEAGYMVFTEVTAGGVTHMMWLPVMDFKNKAMKNATMTDINKTIMRCLTKNLAMHGLGLYIYSGEDLPEEDSALERFEVKANSIQTSIELEDWYASCAGAVSRMTQRDQTKCADIFNKRLEWLMNAQGTQQMDGGQ